MRINGILFIVLAMSCCAQQSQHKVEKSSQTNPPVQTVDGYKDDFPAEYYEVQCTMVLKNDIGSYWAYDSVKKEYSSNQILLDEIRRGIYICLEEKDTSFVGSIFGRNYTLVNTPVIGSDSITLVLTYKHNHGKLNFEFRNGKNLKRITFN